MANSRKPAAAKPGVPRTGAAAQAGIRPAASTANRPALEAQLSASANTIYDAMLDLNISMADVGKEWDKAMALRSRLLQAYGVPAAQARPPAGRAVAPPTAHAVAGLPAMAGLPAPVMAALAQTFGGAGAAAGEGTDYKGKLQQMIGKKFKKSLGKGDLEYQVEPVEGDKSYNCTLIGADLSQQYCNEAPAPSKRAAEQGAAKAALEAEFPAAAAEIGASSLAAMFAQGGAVGCVKRKEPGAATINGDSKSRLMRTLQILLGRPVLKTDIVYTTEAVGTEFHSTVTFPQYDPSASHRGTPAPSGKQAEMSAAEVASQALAGVVAPLEEERKAKRAKQNKESLEKLKEATKAKKEAAKALQATQG